MNKHKGQSGFTLIEVVIVVAIIGLISMFAIPSYMESVRKSRIAQIAQDLVSLAGDIETRRMRGIAYNSAETEAYVVTKTDVKYSGENIATIVLSGATVRAYTLKAAAGSSDVGEKCVNMSINNLGERKSSADDDDGNPDNDDTSGYCWK